MIRYSDKNRSLENDKKMLVIHPKSFYKSSRELISLCHIVRQNQLTISADHLHKLQIFILQNTVQNLFMRFLVPKYGVRLHLFLELHLYLELITNLFIFERNTSFF